MADLDLLYINGINAASGDYDFPPMTVEALSKIARGQPLDTDEIRELQQKAKKQGRWVTQEGLASGDLAQCGWGVIFAQKDQDQIPAIREALQPLLDWRRSQAARLKEQRYKEFTGRLAYRPDETKNDFLARHGMGPGPADPDKVPYYLLIVADPETLPYRVQYQLDVQYAVGRIHFDALEDYARYAHNVVLAEQKAPFLSRQMTFFGAANADDPSTQSSAEHLILPLATHMAQRFPGWSITTCLPEPSTKAQLDALLNGGADQSSLLFTASHGLGFPPDHALQKRHQGALLCQDWPGPRKWQQAIPEGFYFSGDDLGSNANLLGLIAFFFACYGAGTPRLDEFAHLDGELDQIAPAAFAAHLPRRMLQQGALAVIGHVERCWGTSFKWQNAGPQLEVFKSNFKRLLEGLPIGSAFEFFNDRYAEISSDLTQYLKDLSEGATADDERLAQMWTANNDARGYVIVGDPAVRLPALKGTSVSAERPGLAAELASFQVGAAAASPEQMAQETAGQLVEALKHAADLATQVKAGADQLDQLHEMLNQAQAIASTLQGLKD